MMEMEMEMEMAMMESYTGLLALSCSAVWMGSRSRLAARVGIYNSNGFTVTSGQCNLTLIFVISTATVCGSLEMVMERSEVGDGALTKRLPDDES